MKAALPVWGQRLSPVFDFAHRLLVVEIEIGAVTKRRNHPMNPSLPPVFQAAMLTDMGVEVVICGSISRELATMIRSSGIRIISGITGDIGDILQAYLNDTLYSPRFQVPGVHTATGRDRHGRISTEDER